MNMAEDGVLLARWAHHGEHEAFRQLVLRYSGMVYGTCRRMTGSAAFAEELAQDCFEQLAQAGVKPGSYLGPWLHRVAVNRATSALRQERRRHAREERYAAEMPACERAALWDDIYPLVDEAVAALPEKFRVPLIAHFYEGQTHEAVAERLGLTRQAVSYRIAQGVERVRKHLARKGVGVTALGLSALMGANLAEAAPVVLQASLNKIALAGPVTPPVAYGAMALVGKCLAGVTVAVVVGFTWAYLGGVLGARGAEDIAASEGGIVVPEEIHHGTGGESASLAAVPGSVPAGGAVVGAAADEAISGRVYDADTGRSIAAAIMVKGNTKTEMVHTDGEGRYGVGGLPDGEYTLEWCKAPGYPPPREREKKHVQVTGGFGGVVDFAVRRGVPVRGRVTDMDGNPFRAALFVSLNSEGVLQGNSDSNGFYEIYGCHTGEKISVNAFSVFVKPKRESYWRVAQVGDAGVDGVDLTVMPLGRLSGRVTSAVSGTVEKKPVRARCVSLLVPPLPETNTARNNIVATDAEGCFELEELYPGDYQVGLEQEGVEVLVTVGPGEHVEGVALVSHKPAPEVGPLTISGRVVNDAGVGLSDMEVNAMGGNGALKGKTSASGAFRIEGCVEQEYTLNVACGGEYEWADVNAVRGGTQGVEIRLEKRVRPVLMGRVVRADTREPLTQFEVAWIPDTAMELFGGNISLSFLSGAGMGRKTVEDAEGQFQLEAPSREPGHVVAVSAGFAPASCKFDGTPVELSLAAETRLTGLVTDELGAPVADALVCMGIAETEGITLPGPRLAATDETGRFDVGGLCVGRLSLAVTHANYLASFTDVVLTARQAMDVRVVLNRGGKICGMVTCGGVPQAEQRVYIGSLQVGVNPVITNAAGRFVVEAVPAETVTVRASYLADRVAMGRERTLERPVDVAAGRTTEVNFDFVPATAAIGGRILFNGTIPESGDVTLFVETGEGAEECFTTQMDEAGAYEFAAVPSGAGRLACHIVVGQEKRYAQRAMSLSPEQACVVDIDFSGGAAVAGSVTGAGPDDVVSVMVFRAASYHGQIDFGSADAATVPGKDGTFILDGLSGGDFVVVASSVDKGAETHEEKCASLHFVQAPVVLGDGQVQDVALELR